MVKAEILNDTYQVYYQCRLVEVQKKSHEFPATTPQDCFRRRNAPVLQSLRPCSSEATARPGKRGTRKLQDQDVLTGSRSTGSMNFSKALGTWTLSPLPVGQSRSGSKQPGKAWANAGTVPIVRSFETVPAQHRRSSTDRNNEAKQEATMVYELEKEAITTEEEERAFALLQRSSFFRSLEPEVLAELPRMASFLEAPKGAVVFRQGDPPAHCWLIVRGEVAFFIGSGNQDTPRLPVSAGFEDVHVPMPWEESARVRTLDGVSTTSLQSDLGKCVGKARSGAVFGELALMHKDATRKAAATCLTNCEFLLLPASAFKIAKDRLIQLQEAKKKFLNRFVPGMKAFPEPGPNDPPHPSFFFNKLKVDQDFIFLKQGERDSRVIYVIYRGNVHLKQEKENGAETCQTLLPRQLFGSWINALEPLSAVAATTCEVWFVKASDMRLLPSALLKAIQEHLSEEYSQLLKSVHVTRRYGWDVLMPNLMPHPKPLPRHEDPDRWAEHILHQVHDQEMRTQFFAATIGEDLVNRQWRP